MKRTELKRKKPMARSRAPKMTASRQPKARPGHDKKMLQACRGERCYLAIPGVCHGDVATVVPCHANWSAYGKGMGIKARDEYTVPGCMHCHAELDAGRYLTKEEKRTVWESAFAEWLPVRAKKLDAMVAASTATKTNARVIGASTPRRAYGSPE